MMKEKDEDSSFKSFLRHSLNYVSASFFLKGVSVLSIPIVTFLLTPEEYGQIGIFTSLNNVLVVLLSFNIFTSVVRYYHEEGAQMREFLFTVIVFLLIWLSLFNLIFFSSKGNIPLLERFGIDERIFLGAILSASLLAFIRTHLSYLQSSSQSKWYTRIATAKGLVILFSSVAFYYFLKEERFLGRIYSEVGGHFIFFVISGVFFIRFCSRKFKVGYLKYALLYSIPLLPHTLSTVLLKSSDRIIVNQLLGTEQTGFYTFAYQVGIIAQIAITGATKSWAPMFYNKAKLGHFDQIKNLANKYKKLVYILIAGLILFGVDFISLISNSAFHEGLVFTPVIILAYAFMFIYTIYGYYSMEKKRTGLIALNTVIATTVNIVLNYLFIPQYGYGVAAITTLVAYIVLAFLQYLTAKRLFGENCIPLVQLSSGIPVLIVVFGLNYLIDFNFDQLGLRILFKSVIMLLILRLYFWEFIKGKLTKV